MGKKRGRRIKEGNSVFYITTKITLLGKYRTNNWRGCAILEPKPTFLFKIIERTILNFYFMIGLAQTKLTKYKRAIPFP